MFPPKESWSNLVSFESRYGMCFDFPSTSADITFPSALRDRLIFVAYFSRSPSAWVLDCLYEPAKSTRFNLAPIYLMSVGPCSSLSIKMVKMLWDRDEFEFIKVAPTARFLKPKFKYRSISSTLWTVFLDKSLTYTPLSGDSLISFFSLISLAILSAIYRADHGSLRYRSPGMSIGQETFFT